MQKLFLRLLVIVALAGCQTLGVLCPASQGIFSAATVHAQDLNYLLDLDPDAVTNRPGTSSPGFRMVSASPWRSLTLLTTAARWPSM